jgi:hypothetical protein
MNNEARKAAVARYKERKVAAGIYVVRCTPTNQRWVGRAQDLSTAWNRIAFTLRQGANTHRTLQAAWREHGAEGFAFEELERLEEEEIVYVRDRLLKERLDYWCAALGAEPI